MSRASEERHRLPSSRQAAMFAASAILELLLHRLPSRTIYHSTKLVSKAANSSSLSSPSIFVFIMKYSECPGRSSQDSCALLKLCRLMRCDEKSESCLVASRLKKDVFPGPLLLEFEKAPDIL
mmetsp:Transcript_81952/g.264576  ORF Transcript_81952/g.264576 Transcript_81952/m.264576 type:complete len:123 (-) Transcript_81952:2478-2846(-)|eukprot:CAMPEP_0204014242 /NCGR_PEP_ID=MMETSP0360-20130528/25255_1 /ASSEMBLY_ACC=CAM_ASM_000342 /TAXON_ID=268821 /ORGANISM="Scrippsiella Hangoei, Strain SHTV-5" /LENGTH=122 /DNA_ID=CAMNT_0050957067 /DNA_START=147 /DNA_END=515 /DNA_ORIENTATION=+